MISFKFEIEEDFSNRVFKKNFLKRNEHPLRYQEKHEKLAEIVF